MQLSLVVFAAVMLGETIGYLSRVAYRAGGYTEALRVGYQVPVREPSNTWGGAIAGAFREGGQHGAEEKRGPLASEGAGGIR